MRASRALGLVLLLSLPTFAETPKLSVIFGLGPSLPASPSTFSKSWDVGPNFSTGLECRLKRKLSIGGYAGLDRFRINTQDFIENSGLGSSLDQDRISRDRVAIRGGNITIFTVWLQTKARFFDSSKFNPYVESELGYLHYSRSEMHLDLAFGSIEPDRIDGETESAFAVSFGLGFELAVRSGAKIFGEIRYPIGFTDGDKIQFVSFRIGGHIPIGG